MSQTWRALNLTMKRQNTFTEQLARILEYIGKLNELETDDVPPTSHIHPHQVFIMGSQEGATHVAKPDVVKPSYPREEGPRLTHLNLKRDTSVFPEWLTAAIK